MSGGESKSILVTGCLDGQAGIHRLVEASRGFAMRQRLAEADGARLAIVVEELLFNLVDHGGVAAADMVALSLDLGDDGVLLGLDDPGQAYDPRRHQSDGIVPERGGGAGLDLVAAWTTILDYRSGDGRNRLDLLLPLRG